MLLASSGQIPGMLLNTLQYKGQPHYREVAKMSRALRLGIPILQEPFLSHLVGSMRDIRLCQFYEKASSLVL